MTLDEFLISRTSRLKGVTSKELKSMADELKIPDIDMLLIYLDRLNNGVSLPPTVVDSRIYESLVSSLLSDA